MPSLPAFSPVPAINGKSYVVYLQLDLKEPWSRARKEAIFESAVSSGVLVIFTVLLWIWLNRVVTRRVNHIVEGANDLALGRAPPSSSHWGRRAGHH